MFYFSDASQRAGPSDFFRFEEKKNKQQQKGSKTFKNFIKRANTLKENTTFGLSQPTGPVLRDKKAVEELTSLREELSVKLQLKDSLCNDIIKFLNTLLEKMENFLRKYEKMDAVSDMVQDAYLAIVDRVENQGYDRTLGLQVAEECENFLMSHCYNAVFTALSIEEEQHDLGILQRIRSLHWVRAYHLDLNVDDIHPTVKEFMDEAITQIIFIDSKRSLKEKFTCIVSAAGYIYKMLQSAPSAKKQAAGADELLPALVYVVLRANPPRLSTNLKLLSRFSVPSRRETGESGYYFTHFYGAVTFIRNLTAEQLQMPQEEFELYVSGKAVPTEDALTEGARMMYHNRAALQELSARQGRLAEATEQLKLTLQTLHSDIVEQVKRTLERTESTTRPHEYRVPSHINSQCIPAFLRDKVIREEPPPSPLQPSDLPSPLKPQILHEELPPPAQQVELEQLPVDL